MNNLLSKFNPFFLRKEEMPSFGSAYVKWQTYAVYLEEPNNSDFFMVVNRGVKEDCEMIVEHLNDLMQKHLRDFILQNKEEVFTIVAKLKQDERERTLSDLGFEEPTTEDIARGKFGAGF